MLTIYADDQYRVTPDKKGGWRVEEYTISDKKNGIKKWVPISWPYSLEGALRTIVRMRLCGDEIQTLADALVEVDRVSQVVLDALTPNVSLDRVDKAVKNRLSH